MEKKKLHVEELEDGMLSAEDVKIFDKVLILHKNMEIESKHMSLLKTAGVNELVVLIPSKDESSREKTHISDYPKFAEALKNTRVMIVDDSKLMRLKLKKIVEEAGLNLVGEAEDGQKAVEMVEELQPTLITMDIEMPNLDGLSAISPIHEKLPDVKIIMISSLGYEDKIIEAISNGALDFINKPFDPDRVKRTIFSALTSDFMI
jgi:two-component system, chemotaxis family, chemotaxis protein CheY